MTQDNLDALIRFVNEAIADVTSLKENLRQAKGRAKNLHKSEELTDEDFKTFQRFISECEKPIKSIKNGLEAMNQALTVSAYTK